jgi:hypothetical protein
VSGAPTADEALRIVHAIRNGDYNTVLRSEHVYALADGLARARELLPRLMPPKLLDHYLRWRADGDDAAADVLSDWMHAHDEARAFLAEGGR